MSVLRIIPVALLLATCSRPAVQQVTVQPGAAGAASSITAADMRSRIAFLASDALRGRDTPSPGLDTAAAWIAREFQRLGLEPGGENGTYFQRYPFIITTVSPEGAVWSGLQYGADFYVLAGTPLDIQGEMVAVNGSLSDAPAASIRGKVPVVRIPGQQNRAWRGLVTSA